MNNVVIRPLNTVREMMDVELLQKAVWDGDPAYIMHPHFLFSIAANGGLVLGAHAGDELVGFSVSILGTDSQDKKRPAMADLKLFSMLIGVAEGYRNSGIGYHLKVAQREYASNRGIRLINWLFDPLRSDAAHMSIRKLGTVVSNFLPGYDGANGSLSRNENMDRFQADWWLTSWRVAQRLKGKRSPLTLNQYIEGGTRILNPARLNSKAQSVPSDEFVHPPTALGLVEIPTNFERLSKVDDGLALAWRGHSQAVFEAVLGNGYIFTDFVSEPYEGRQRSFYVCSHEGSLQKFTQN